MTRQTILYVFVTYVKIAPIPFIIISKVYKRRIKLAQFQDLTGQRFGRLTVIERAPNIKRPCGVTVVRWKCQCDCGSIIITDGVALRRGDSKSCGCLQKEVASQMVRKRPPKNTYDLTGDFGIGYINNKNKAVFYFDLEDYDKIKGYTWYSSHGYISTRERGNQKLLRLHRLVMNAPSNKVVDHINHNPLDNRKENLRVCNQSDNTINRKSAKNYTGVQGVRLMPSGKWETRLTYHGKVYIKRFPTLEEAVSYRKQLEEKYFGEFRYKEN